MIDDWVVWDVEDGCDDGVITRITLDVWLVPPPLPVTVKVNDPVAASEAKVSVRVDPKFGVPEGVLNAPLTPCGNPDTVRVTGELKPFMAET
jgi:hypothetical protein